MRATYGGELEIDRRMIKQVLLLTKEEPLLIYNGPRGREEWKPRRHMGGRNRTQPNTGNSVKNSWIYKKGGLYTSSFQTIVRKENTPERVGIELVTDWRQMGLTLILFAEDKENLQHADRYELRLLSGVASLMRYEVNEEKAPAAGRGVPVLFGRGGIQARALTPGPVRVPELLPREDGEMASVKIGIYVDKKEKEITLLVNDVVFQTWKDPHKKETWEISLGSNLVWPMRGEGGYQK